MLEVGAVVDAGREQHDGGVAVAARRDVLQHGEQILRVVIDWAHADRAEKIGERALHRHAVLQQVRDAGGAAAVVLEHVVGPLVVANEIAAADVDVDAAGRIEAHHLGPEMLRRLHVLARDLALLDDPLLVVDVLKEEIEREHALLQPGLDLHPFRVRNDARHQVERENALGALLVAVDGEGDALAQEGGVHRAAALLEFVALQIVETLKERGVMGPDLPGRDKHLVEEIAGLVGVEQRHG